MRPEPDSAALAAELRLALGQIVRRLRAEQGFSLPQGAVLGRLDRDGPQSISDLAAGAHMRAQSMAQTVRELEEGGLVERRPDPGDKRRAFVELTDAGREAIAANRARRDGWLTRALETELSDSERALLDQVAPLLRRLADA
jgi:DNA-binding MarR family transcriptional regulator